MRIMFLAVFLSCIMFPTHQASFTTKLQETKKPPSISSSLFNSKNEKIQTTTAPPHGHHAFKHLEDHINSLKHLTNHVPDHRTHILHIPLLFACLENDSTYENCDKINDFM